MSATVTVTGKTGTGLTMTAQQFTGILYFTVDTEQSMLTIKNSSGVTTQVAITAATTITATKSGTTWTLVIS